MRIRSTTLASRGRVAKTPPFGEEICCLAGFLGETGDSGPNPGLDGRAESREIIAGSRTNYGRNFSHVSESRSGLKTGDFMFVRTSAHEGRGGEETATPGVEKSMLISEKMFGNIVSGKRKVTRKNSYRKGEIPRKRVVGNSFPIFESPNG